MFGRFLFFTSQNDPIVLQCCGMAKRLDDHVRNKCFHPSGVFHKFLKEDVETSIPQRFEKTVLKHPYRLAVNDGKKSINYSELNKASNRIAHAILQRTREQGQNIAIVIQHGIDTVRAIFGVLKSGNCYVPLDPGGPPERLKYILETTKASVVLTNGQNIEFARSIASAELKLIDIDNLGFQARDENTGIKISGDSFAYILFTSGSTGEPKGVIQNHRNTLHDCMCYTNNLHISPNDRVGLLASVWVGASVHYLYGSLLNGASLFPLDLKQNGLACLARWLVAEKISFFQLSANVFRHFLKTLSGAENFSEVRLIALGGGQPNCSDIEGYRRNFDASCILLNRLSTTETNTIVWNFIAKESCADNEHVPVGHSVEDTEILLLDESGAKIGIDSIGEIAVRSRYLSPGYWSRPDLTQVAFEPDPNSAEVRLFHTGDLGRIDKEGALHYVGRKDSRVKIRGYTVEIAEVERALSRHAGIGEVLVIAEKSKVDDYHLLAYLIPNSREFRLSTHELRNYLLKSLPDYMVPTAFVVLDALPLTASGKVDRQALLVARDLLPQMKEAYRAPTTSVEIRIAGIWAKVLDVDRVGIDDNFFYLGGDSLLATEIICRIRDEFKIEMTFSEFFRNPTITEIAGYLYQHQRNSEATYRLPVSQRFGPNQFPLSVTQQSLWFLYQLDPKSSMYNETFGLRFKGNVNREILQESIEYVVERHDALRSNFFSEGGEPYQVIRKHQPIELPLVDLTACPPSAQMTEFHRRAGEIAEKPFNLSRDLMLRAVVFRLSPVECILVCVFHHIATDGASDDIFIEELVNSCEQLCAGRQLTALSCRLRYVDFVHWQRQRMQGALLEKQLSYWKRQLAGIPELLMLPTDRPRPPVQSYRGATHSIVLSKELTDGLRTLSNREGVTLFMTLLAAFQTLLYRLSGQRDIVVGSPISGRNQSEFEGVIGLFLNTLILRTYVGDNPEFGELLSRVREVALEAYDHQEVPYEKLMGDLQFSRTLSHNSLFQVMFAFRHDPMGITHQPTRFSLDRISIERQAAKFDLNLAVYERADNLRCHFTYATDLFSHATIERIADCYSHLLEAIVANPRNHLSDLSILDDSERHRQIFEWNNSKRDYPQDKCIHELFEEQVERTPDAVAVVYEDEQLTYRELNTKANQLAHYLRELKVDAPLLVGLCVHRSLEMIIGLLGIIKAGGAYVPLDPAYPTERLKFMLQDAQVSVLLTQQSLLSDVFVDLCPKVFCLDTDWEKVAGQGENCLDKTATAEDLVYVIYTSGSTGNPKGVEVTHKGVVNLALSACEVLDLSHRDRVLQFSSISFDTSVEEIFPSLICGATLVLRTDSMIDAPSVFLECCREWGLTVLDLPTAYWHELAQTMFSERLAVAKSIRTVIIGGERASKERLMLWHQSVGNSIRLINTYGPTESTVTVAVCDLTQHPTETSWNGELPIGRPIPNVQIYILDNLLSPVPIGIAGELCIGGRGLARGYLNRTDLTKEKFVPNPFNSELGAKLYKTGDIARYLPDGNIEFLRRIDDQVKIRGFRIEIGEIEATLRQHQSIKESVVLAREETDNHRLIAYVVAVSSTSVSDSELRSYLRLKLPDYMIPSSFVFLDVLPRSPNRKVDRKRLPADTCRADQKFVAPRTPTEKLLASIWEEVLKIKNIGVYDNFFDLGGHSLLAMQVVSRVRKIFHIEIALRCLIEHPTVNDFALLLTKALLTRFGPQEEIEDLLSWLESLQDEEGQRLT